MKYHNYTAAFTFPHTGSTFEIDFTFTTQNGTGTGEIVLIINTRDGLPLSKYQLTYIIHYDMKVMLS